MKGQRPPGVIKKLQKRTAFLRGGKGIGGSDRRTYGGRENRPERKRDRGIRGARGDELGTLKQKNLLTLCRLQTFLLAAGKHIFTGLSQRPRRGGRCPKG